MTTENKIIISDNNFKAKTSHLQNDMFLYHRLNDDDFKGSNTLNYYIALLHDGKFYDLNIKSIYQFKDSYNFENAVNTTIELLKQNNITGLKDDYMKSMIQAIEEKKWIYKWLFDIIKDYDNKNNTNYLSLVLKQRDEQLKANEQKREEEKQRRIEEERKREEKAKEEQKIKDKENYCNGFTYDIPTGNGEIRKIAMYQFAELHWLWERYSNERLASFLILDDYTFNNFIKWLKG